MEIAKSVKGVKGVHNVITHKTKGKAYCNLHVMVNREINLVSAHKISEIIEDKIQKEIPDITHATIHLEPFLTVPKNFNIEDTVTEEKLKKLLKIIQM